MKTGNLIISALVAVTLAASPASAFAAKSKKSSKKQAKITTLSAPNKLSVVNPASQKNLSKLKYGLGTGFNGGFYGHSGGE